MKTVHFHSRSNGIVASGKTRDAIEQFETAIEANPDFPYIHTVLGFAYYLENQ